MKPKKPPPPPDIVDRVAKAVQRNPRITDHALAAILRCTADEVRAARRKVKNT